MPTGRRSTRILLILGQLCVAGAAAGQTLFEDVSAAASARDWATIEGAAAGDYDNDGRPDLLVVGRADTDLMRLLHNEGGTRFVDRIGIVEGGVPASVKGWGSLFGDYDNDGDLDLFQPAGGVGISPGVDLLLRNDRGRLRDVAAAAGLTQRQYTYNALWLDYDRDGHLDLYVGHWEVQTATAPEGPPADPPFTNELYRNRGDGTFEDVTAATGLDVDLRRGMGSASGMIGADFDGDGWPDLYVAVWSGPNRLFRNQAGAAFEDVTSGDLGNDGRAHGVAAGD